MTPALEDLDIVYSDDEDDIIERVYFLCDISETKVQKTPEIDISQLLQSKEESETIEEPTVTQVESIVKNEIIGEREINIVRIAIEEGIPQKFIFYDNEDELINLKNVLRGMDSTTGLYMVTRNYFKITPLNYMMIYFLANYEKMDNDELIGQLNKIQNITEKNFNQITFEEYVREISIIVQENVKIMKIKLEKIEKFYSEINSLSFSNQPEDIERTLRMVEVKMEIFSRDGEYQFDIDSGEIVFDNMRTTSRVPLILYVSFTNNFYKINEDTDLLGDVFDEEYKLEEKYENHIYLFVRVTHADSIKIQVVDLDLEQSKISFSYPGNTLNQIKEYIKKIIPNIVYVEEKKTSLRGSFEIDFENYSDLRMRYLCLMNEMFSSFFYVKENANPRSLRKNIKYYFKNYEEKGDYSLYFSMEKKYANHFTITFNTHENKRSNVSEFILILSKMITYYNKINFEETLIPNIEERYTGPDGDGLGGEFIPEGDEKVKISSKKLDNLQRRAPGMFPGNIYGKFCPCSKQPVIIDEEDVKDWKDYNPERNVVLFPPAESTQRTKKYNFVCPDNRYPYLYFMQTKKADWKYPILPCCGINPSLNNHILNYDKIREDEVEYWSRKNEGRVRREIRLKTIKILSPNQTGVLPGDLNSFLKKIKNVPYIRTGVIKSDTASFIHCIIKASSHLEEYVTYIDPRNKEKISNVKNIIQLRNSYLERNIKEKIDLVNAFRKNLGSFVNLACSTQETYQFSLSQVEDFAGDREKIFDSTYYYRILEQIFMLNIFVFLYQNDTVTIEKPNHNYYHIRDFNPEFPTVLIFKHLSERSIPSYELIQVESKSESPILRDSTFLEDMKNFIETKNYSIGILTTDEGRVMKNANNGIKWDFILKDYNIISQDVNDSGRLIKINISLKRGEKMSIFTQPSYPLNVKISKMIYETKKETVTEIFGDDYIIGSEGFWYSVKDFKYGIFIPVKGVRPLQNKEKQSFAYILLKNSFTTNQQINNISIVRKNANIIKQIVLWLWNLSDIVDVDEWFDMYTCLMTEKKLIDIINLTPIKVDYRFPQEVKGTEDGIYHYEEILPLIFNMGKIQLYEELRESLRIYIRNYQNSLSGYEKYPNKSIINIFTNESDFKKHSDTKIIIGRNNYEQYFNKLKNTENDIEDIQDFYSSRLGVFNYRSTNDGNYFLVQNTYSERKEEAIIVSLIWNIYRVNLGYDVMRNTIWKHFPDYPFLLEFFSYTKEELIRYSNSETDIESQTFEEAVYYLAKEGIGMPTDHFKKEASVRYRSSEGMYEELKPGLEEADVWEYGNGAYAAMLIVSK